jgi:hypothetical protein
MIFNVFSVYEIKQIKTTVREIGVVPTLLELLDKHTNDAAIVKSAANCLDYLGRRCIKTVNILIKRSLLF